MGLPLGTCKECMRKIELVPESDYRKKQATFWPVEAGRLKLLVSDFEYLTFVAFAATLEQAGTFDDLLADDVSAELEVFVNRGVCKACHK